MKRCVLFCLLSLALTGCALRGTYEVGGVKTADALSETYPADAERFATQAALELSRRYPAGQTGLSLVTVPGMFGTALETNLRGFGFAILPVESSGVKVGYVLDEITGELHPTGYLQLTTSDGTSFSMVRRLLGGLPAAPTVPALAPSPVSAPEEPAPGTPVVLPPSNTPLPPAVPEKPLRESVAQTAAKPAAPTPVAAKNEPSANATIPLITAVRTIIPVGWQYHIHGTEIQAAMVPYPRNIAWRRALMDLATATDSQVFIDGKGKLITFTPKGMQAPSLPAQQAAALPTEGVSAMRPQSPAVAKALHEVAAETSGAAPAPAAGPQPQIAASSVPASTPAVTIVAEPMLPEWQLTQGSLRAQLEAWTKRADYQLVWSADTDLDMQSRASFRGNFIGAITQLFEGLHAAGFPLTATIYQANNVLEVGNK